MSHLVPMVISETVDVSVHGVKPVILDPVHAGSCEAESCEIAGIKFGQILKHLFHCYIDTLGLTIYDSSGVLK